MDLNPQAYFEKNAQCQRWRGKTNNSEFFHFEAVPNLEILLPNPLDGDFFYEEVLGSFCNMVNIFTCRCPNRFEVGGIDSPDRFEQVLDQSYIPEVSEKISRTTFR